jgi:hypothetical protein
MWLVVLGLSLLLAACAVSLQEVREEKPMHTGDFPRPYQPLARCVYDQLDAQIGQGGVRSAPSASPLLAGLPDLLYRLDDEPPRRRVRVSATSAGPPSSAVFEITVVPTAEEGSHVEYRRRAWLSGRMDQATWAIVNACGQPD